MLGFRLKEGLNLEAVASRYGRTAVRRIEEGIAEGLTRGWVIHEQRSSGSRGGGGGVGGIGGDSGSRGDCRTEHAGAVGGGEDEKGQNSGGGGEGLGTLRLADPDGFLFSNSVISSVFCELDGWKRGEEEQREGAGTAR